MPFSSSGLRKAGPNLISVGASVPFNSTPLNGFIVIGDGAFANASLDLAGDYCTVLGNFAGENLKGNGLTNGFGNGVEDTLLGWGAGRYGVDIARSVIVGDSAGYYANPELAVIIGYSSCGAGLAVTSPVATYSVIIGAYAAIDADGDCFDNVIIGFNSTPEILGGIGIIGSENVIIGSNSAVLLTTGGGNLIIGKDAGGNITTGNYNFIMGYGANPPNGNNQFFIGIGATPLIQGDFTSGVVEIPGGLAPTSPIVTKTSAYPVTINDGTLLGNAAGGSFAFTLPTATTGKNHVYVFKKIDASANTVTISPVSGAKIDGAANYVLTAQWQKVTIQSNGTDWFILSA